ncbi:MAG: GNAT family N-acetyltransferase [Oscillospiraceae bacterium]|nr:GNAT family N-acetyltransferase [Oscillospiraceae bacterium]
MKCCEKLPALEYISHAEFPQVYALLEQSFPPEERRSFAGQKALLQREEYRLLAVTDPRGNLRGIMGVWEFADFIFLEHFAVDPACRNSGLGTKMLTALKENYAPKAICLEAELPTEEMSRRRQEFYKRNGFSPRHQSYIQPSLGEDRSSIPLQILSTAEETDLPFEHIRKELYTKVYAVEL